MGIDYFNLVEGMFWISVGIWLVLTRRFVHRQQHYMLSITLVVFGISDFVEMHTGVWWTPAWLLVWKAVCIGVFIIIFILHFYERGRRWRRK